MITVTKFCISVNIENEAFLGIASFEKESVSECSVLSSKRSLDRG